MKIINLKTDQLIPYVNNPRHNEDAVDALTSGEQVLSVDVDLNTVRDVPQPVTIWTATLSIAGSTTTE